MSPAPPVEAATPTPFAWTPRCLRALLLVALGIMLLASVGLSTCRIASRQAQRLPAWTLTHDILGAARGTRLDPRVYTPLVFAAHPKFAMAVGVMVTHLCILGAVALLSALFCARLGMELGQAPELGILPVLLNVSILMLIVGAWDGLAPGWPIYTPRRIMIASQIALPKVSPWNPALLMPLFLAFFCVVRADLPASSRAGIGWTVAGGAFGGWCVWTDPFSIVSVAALGLYAGGSAGWRRGMVFGLGAMISGGLVRDLSPGWVNFPPNRLPDPWLSAVMFLATALVSYRLRHWMPRHPSLSTEAQAQPGNPAGSTSAPLPTGSARRIIGFLLFVALMSAPTAIVTFPRVAGSIYGWQFFALPLVVAGGMALTIRMELR